MVNRIKGILPKVQKNKLEILEPVNMVQNCFDKKVNKSGNLSHKQAMSCIKKVFG